MNEDFLPQPPPPPPKKKSAGRTLLQWVVFILMFVTLYTVFDGGGASSESSGPSTGYSGWWFAVPLAVGLLPFSLLAWQWSGTKRFQAALTEGLDAMAQGNHRRASALFAALAKRYRRQLPFRAVASYNQGYALLLDGDTSAAVGVLLGVERTANLGAGGARWLASVQLARAFAIGGDVVKADAWLAAARERTFEDQILARAMLASAEALVRARQGRYDDALATYARHDADIETYLPIRALREVWLVRAFAIAMTSGPRDAAAVESPLRMLRATTRPGQLVWLTRHWPELAAFALANELPLAA